VRAVVVAAAVILLAASSASAQADIEATAIAISPDPGIAGQYVDIGLTVTNLGPGVDPGPLGDIQPSVALQYDCVVCEPNGGLYLGIQSYYIEPPSLQTEWFVYGLDPGLCTLFVNTWSDAGSDPGNTILWNDYYFISCPLGEMVSASQVSYAIGVPLTEGEPPISTRLLMNPPGPLGGETVFHQPMLFGQPLDRWGLTADIELVDSGGANPSEGCDPLIGFTAGNIALIDRGSCEYSEKAVYAEAAGATAVLVANQSNHPDNPNDQIWGNWGAGAFGSAVTIPVMLISWDDGQLLRQPDANATLSAVFPDGADWTFRVEGLVLNQLNDPNPDNDVLVVDVAETLPLFADGFESGDTMVWSRIVP
jgi:hypothetical protein